MKVEDVPEEWVHDLAASLDHPSVFMGGPSERSKKRARAALAAVIPAIQAEALERAAVVADKELADAQADMAMAGDSDPTGFQQSEGAAHASERIQSAIRALKEGT